MAYSCFYSDSPTCSDIGLSLMILPTFDIVFLVMERIMLCPLLSQIQKIASRWHAKGAISDGFLLWWGFPLKVK